MKSVRINDNLYNQAEAEAELLSRSINGQIEHWIKLGMALESMSDSAIRNVLLLGKYEEADLTELKKASQERFVRQVELGISSTKDASFSKNIVKNIKARFDDVEY